MSGPVSHLAPICPPVGAFPLVTFQPTDSNSGLLLGQDSGTCTQNTYMPQAFSLATQKKLLISNQV